MIKAIFLDYTGTMVKEDEPYTRELLEYMTKHCNTSDQKLILAKVWGYIKEVEATCYGDGFRLNHYKVDYVLDHLAMDMGFDGDRNYVHEIWEKVWIYASLHDDVKPFFERCSLPIYILSNDDLRYLEESMAIKGLKPEGIISAECARACKPSKEIYEYALKTAGVSPEEVIFIGDSVTSDIIPALEVGITPVYIARKEAKVPEGVQVIHSLDEINL